MKHTLTITSLFIFVISHGQNFSISGSITKGESKTIYLLDPHQKEIDSTTIKDNQFWFKGTVSEPNIYYLKVKDFQGASSILLDNSNINVIADAEQMWTAKKSGSELLEENKSFHQRLSKYYVLQNEAFDKAMEAMNNNDSINSIKYENLNIEYTNAINDSAASYIQKHPKSLVSLLQLKEKIELFSLEKSRELFENLSDDLKNHSIGKDIQYRLFIIPNTLRIGKTAPEIEGVNIRKKRIKLSDYRGKYVLLDFWASWCAPCRKEIPFLKELYDTYYSKGFEILSFSLDTKKDNLSKALSEEHFPWENISDLKGFSSEIARKYNVTEIPKNFLISPDGKVIDMNKHDGALANLLKELFDK